MSLAVLVLLLIFDVSPSISTPLFNSRDPLVSSVIKECRLHITSEQDHHECYAMLGCILASVPVEYTARWSAGANILGFIPTIVALMSNSIDEITYVGDESLFLALTLALSSLTTFNSRFGHKTNRVSESLFDEKVPSPGSMRVARARLRDLVDQSQKPRSFWRSHRVQSGFCGLVALGIGAGLWYQVVEITTYGIVGFACPVKANMGIWVSLSQLLALVNVFFRRVLFGDYIRPVRAGNSQQQQRGSVGRKATTSLHNREPCCEMILHYPRFATLRQLLRMFNTLASFTLYAYGTVLLASMTLIPASDAVRAMVVAAASAGFGRLAAHCFNSYRRTRSRVVGLEIPASYLEEFKNAIAMEFGPVPK